MFVPYHADVVMERMPIANWVIMGLTIVISLWGFQAPSHLGDVDSGPVYENVEDAPVEWRNNKEYEWLFVETPKRPPTVFDRMVLNGWSVTGFFGHMFLHGGFLHLLGNMLFLFVFGNAVCAKVGNAWYPFVYLGTGLIAALAHVLFDDGPALGASGAINGVVGLFLVYYPINEIRCLWIYYRFGGATSISSYILILIWFAFDVLGAFLFEDGVAYAAHVGGFVAGFSLGSFLLLRGILPTTRYERSFYDALHGRTT